METMKRITEKRGGVSDGALAQLDETSSSPSSSSSSGNKAPTAAPEDPLREMFSGMVSVLSGMVSGTSAGGPRTPTGSHRPSSEIPKRSEKASTDLTDLSEKLSRLAELRATGVLSEAEFDDEAARLLAFSGREGVVLFQVRSRMAPL